MRISNKLIQEACSRSIRNLIRESEYEDEDEYVTPPLPTAEEAIALIIQSIKEPSNNCYFDFGEGVTHMSQKNGHVEVDVDNPDECVLFVYYYNPDTDVEYTIYIPISYEHDTEVESMSYDYIYYTTEETYAFMVLGDFRIDTLEVEDVGNIKITPQQSEEILKYITIEPSDSLQERTNDDYWDR